MKPWVVAALTIGADQFSKAVVRATLNPTQHLPLVPFLHLTYVQNTGTAFGLFRGHPGVFIALSVAVGAWIIVEWRRSHADAPRATRHALALILGGAIGNLIDRVRFGYVVDFIDLRVWPVFNVADSAITIGVGWLLLQLLWKGQGTRSKEQEQ